MRKISLVVLSRYADLFEKFRQFADNQEVDERMLVRDKDSDIVAPADWTVVQSQAPFNYARNANMGVESARGNDILLCNDDIQLVNHLTARKMQDTMLHDSKIGLISPRIRGGCQEVQANPPYPVTRTAHFLAFICVMFSKETWHSVGSLDTRFDGYGMEDVDYCVRVRKAGLDLAVLQEPWVGHGDQRPNSNSFFRAYGWQGTGRMGTEAREKYMQKWGGKGLEDIWGKELTWERGK